MLYYNEIYCGRLRVVGGAPVGEVVRAVVEADVRLRSIRELRIWMSCGLTQLDGTTCLTLLVYCGLICVMRVLSCQGPS